ncbi:hypothetical protein T484DRAFT_1855906 [Baffinella frigidus]|nr:hypothetical protein T484DRAFT_1855906 [Cryptophyta sp. CCMP2293]
MAAAAATAALGSGAEGQTAEVTGVGALVNGKDATQDLALSLLAKWNMFAGARGDPSQSDTKRTSAYTAVMRFLVQASDGRRCASGVPAPMLLRDVVLSNGTTIFEFFRATTQVLQSASSEAWLLALFADMDAFKSDFKHLEANFIILFIIFKKFQKMFCDICRVPLSVLRQAEPATEASTEWTLFAMTWTLFAHIRAETQCVDLLPGFYLAA